jgi:hypothetical protein
MHHCAEEIIFDLIEDSCPDEEDSDSIEMSDSLSPFTSQFISTFNHFVDTFVLPGPFDDGETREHEFSDLATRRAIFFRRKGSELEKAEAVTLNREEFKQLNMQLQKAGMLTNNGTRAVLNHQLCYQSNSQLNRGTTCGRIEDPVDGPYVLTYCTRAEGEPLEKEPRMIRRYHHRWWVAATWALIIRFQRSHATS